MVAPNTVVERLADARRQMDFGLSVVPQSLAGHFLNSSYFAPHLDRLRASLLYKRDLLMEALQKELQGLVHFHVPEGGLHLWCKIVPEVNDSKRWKPPFTMALFSRREACTVQLPDMCDSHMAVPELRISHPEYPSSLKLCAP